MRVNARLDEQSEADLKYLQRVTESSSTDIIKTALSLYASRFREEAKQQKQALLDSGFIGSFKAEPDLSENYKQRVREALDAKYPAQ